MRKFIQTIILVCAALSFLSIRNAAAAEPSPWSVTGKVVDQAGEPVIGAVLTEKDGKGTAVVDLDGNFTINVASSNATLAVSALGYDNLTVGVAGRSRLEIVLSEKSFSIDEVVVVGYGTQKKKDLTGSVVQVDMKTMEDKEAITVADYLRGAVAGLNISRSSSASGQSSFEIRGQTSLGTSTQPLLVVDGSIFSGSLNDINPNDIASVSVMKDASSAAVYGASAANGVIILTTKRGEGDKPRITFSAKTSIAALYNKPESYDVDGYLSMRADYLVGNSNINLTSPEYYTNPYKLSTVSLDQWMSYTDAGQYADPTEVWLSRLALKPNEKSNYYNYKSVDWVDEVFRTGVLQDYNVGLSGRSKNIDYYWSVGYMDNKSIIVGDTYNNIRSHLNLSTHVTDYLEVGVRANLSLRKDDNQDVKWAAAYTNSPLGDMYNEDGTYTIYPNGENMAKNPFETTQREIYSRRTNLQATTFAKLTLPFGFTFESNYTNHWRYTESNSYIPAYTLDGADENGRATRSFSKQYEWSLENILHWQKTFGNHSFDLTLMQSSAKWMQNSTTAKASGFSTTEALTWHALSLADVYSASSSDEEDTKASYMARLNYSLMGKYLASFTFRRDGYSAFGQDNPWGNFPAVALAWRISEEKFLKGNPVVSNLKLRASYGKNGNSNIGRYTALASLASGYYLNQDKTSVVTTYPSSMGNSTLQWEETLTTNVGLDLGFFDDRINLALEYYNMTTSNMLMDRALPTLTGYTKVKSNLGEVVNKGFELTLNTTNISNSKMKWTTDFIFSLNRNKITHLYGDMVDVYDDEGNVIGQKEADDPTNGWYIGHAIDEIYGYKLIGIWQMDEAAEAAAVGRTPGDYKTYLAEGSTSYSSADYVWQGYRNPRYRMSMNNSFRFNCGLSLSFLLRSEFGHKKSCNELNVGGYGDRISQMKFPYWTQENQSDEWGKLGAAQTGNIYKNASFLRIENVSLSYRLPSRWLKKAGIQETKLSFNVDNAYCFNSWLYFDVETKTPIPTTYTVGLSLTL
jgi:TonB-dependent starch-binding outer membrane protein SusC